MKENKIKLLVLQASPLCNINCKYCYLSIDERKDNNRMSVDVITNTCRLLKESNLLNNYVTILWHAGEPLALPIKYYRKAMETIELQLSEVNIRYNFQTNGINITQEWCDFIIEKNISAVTPRQLLEPAAARERV